MDGAQKPAERDPMIQHLEGVPGLGAGRHVNQGEQNAGDDLDEKEDQRCAAKHVPPTRRLTRNRMLHYFAQRLDEIQAFIEPFPEIGPRSHGPVLFLLPAGHAPVERVGNWPA